MAPRSSVSGSLTVHMDTASGDVQTGPGMETSYRLSSPTNAAIFSLSATRPTAAAALPPTPSAAQG